MEKKQVIFCLKCYQVQNKNFIYNIILKEHKKSCKYPDQIEFFLKADRQKVLKFIDKKCPSILNKESIKNQNDAEINIQIPEEKLHEKLSQNPKIVEIMELENKPEIFSKTINKSKEEYKSSFTHTDEIEKKAHIKEQKLKRIDKSSPKIKDSLNSKIDNEKSEAKKKVKHTDNLHNVHHQKKEADNKDIGI